MKTNIPSRIAFSFAVIVGAHVLGIATSDVAIIGSMPHSMAQEEGLDAIVEQLEEMEFMPIGEEDESALGDIAIEPMAFDDAVLDDAVLVSEDLLNDGAVASIDESAPADSDEQKASDDEEEDAATGNPLYAIIDKMLQQHGVQLDYANPGIQEQFAQHVGGYLRYRSGNPDLVLTLHDASQHAAAPDDPCAQEDAQDLEEQVEAGEVPDVQDDVSPPDVPAEEEQQPVVAEPVHNEDQLDAAEEPDEQERANAQEGDVFEVAVVHEAAPKEQTWLQWILSWFGL